MDAPTHLVEPCKKLINEIQQLHGEEIFNEQPIGHHIVGSDVEYHEVRASMLRAVMSPDTLLPLDLKRQLLTGVFKMEKNSINRAKRLLMRARVHFISEDFGLALADMVASSIIMSIPIKEAMDDYTPTVVDEQFMTYLAELLSMSSSLLLVLELTFPEFKQEIAKSWTHEWTSDTADASRMPRSRATYGMDDLCTMVKVGNADEVPLHCPCRIPQRVNLGPRTTVDILKRVGRRLNLLVTKVWLNNLPHISPRFSMFEALERSAMVNSYWRSFAEFTGASFAAAVAAKKEGQGQEVMDLGLSHSYLHSISHNKHPIKLDLIRDFSGNLKMRASCAYDLPTAGTLLHTDPSVLWADRADFQSCTCSMQSMATAIEEKRLRYGHSCVTSMGMVNLMDLARRFESTELLLLLLLYAPQHPSEPSIRHWIDIKKEFDHRIRVQGRAQSLELDVRFIHNLRMWHELPGVPMDFPTFMDNMATVSLNAVPVNALPHRQGCVFWRFGDSLSPTAMALPFILPLLTPTCTNPNVIISLSYNLETHSMELKLKSTRFIRKGEALTFNPCQFVIYSCTNPTVEEMRMAHFRALARFGATCTCDVGKPKGGEEQKIIFQL
jgi:hypothetical protein